MKLYLLLFFTLYLFATSFSTVLMASRPATKAVYYSKSIVSDSVASTEKTKKTITFLNDSIQTKTEPIPEKSKKNGLGLIIGGVFLTLLGVVFGVALLLTFLLGFSIGSGFYFRDIYAIAGVMLTGLISFGVGVYMISRGRERWKAYKRYRKAVKKMRQNNN